MAESSALSDGLGSEPRKTPSSAFYPLKSSSVGSSIWNKRQRSKANSGQSQKKRTPSTIIIVRAATKLTTVKAHNETTSMFRCRATDIVRSARKQVTKSGRDQNGNPNFIAISASSFGDRKLTRNAIARMKKGRYKNGNRWSFSVCITINQNTIACPTVMAGPAPLIIM